MEEDSSLVKSKPKQAELPEKQPLIQPWVWYSLLSLTCLSISDYLFSMFNGKIMKLVFNYNIGQIVAAVAYYNA
jgi:hypothetical protein